MKHIDLFSGIGGFSIAADRVFGEIEHIFVEWDPFCHQILRKHWPKAEIYGDIRKFIADTECRRSQEQGTEQQTDRNGQLYQDSYEGNTIADAEREGREGELRESERQHGLRGGNTEDEKPFILTGGFPCQPFSHAGRRKGTSDDRYLWPEMFRVIQLYKPTWVIAENVRGLVTWNEGMVLEQVCSDLEGEGYEVQPLIIPAVAVGAPHRRDRVWIIGRNTSDTKYTRLNGAENKKGADSRNDGNSPWENEPKQPKRPNSLRKRNADDALDTDSQRERAGHREVQSENGEISERNNNAEFSDTDKLADSNPGQQLWSEGMLKGMETDTTERTARTEADQREHQYTWADDWREVALATCHDGVDDGIPGKLDGFDGYSCTKAQHRAHRLKACGNAIVPQVAETIMMAIMGSK